MRKVFIEDLPKKENRKIDWIKVSNESVHFIYDDIEGDFKIVKCEEIIKSNRKRYFLTIQYKDYDLFTMNVDTLTKGSIGNLLKRNTSDFKIKIGETFKDDKRDLIITNREKMKIERIDKSGRKSITTLKYYKYKCNICGFDGGKHWSIKDKKYKNGLWVDESHLLNEGNCSCCANQIVVEGINDIPTTAPWMVKYFQGGNDEAKKYTKRSNQSIYPICPDCGQVKSKSIVIDMIYKKHSMGCENCGDGKSFCEKVMYNILKQLKIPFISEYSPDWIGLRRYDFYISSMSLIIEMDGGFHKKGNKMNGQTADESKAIDNEKDRLAKEHGIEVIRIDCDYKENDRLNFIKNNILNSKLKYLLNLDNVNWTDVEIVASENLLIQSCILWNEGFKSIYEIKSKLNSKVGNSTIRNYLKRGDKLKLCDYISTIKNNSKQVVILKNNIELGVFKSCSLLCKESEKMFGKRLNPSSVSEVCRGKRKTHKGFTFKYVD